MDTTMSNSVIDFFSVENIAFSQKGLDRIWQQGTFKEDVIMVFLPMQSSESPANYRS